MRAINRRSKASIAYLVIIPFLGSGCASEEGTDVSRHSQESPSVDNAKCSALKSELLSQAAPQVIPIGRFFDGNDDPASIGCNLDQHPGVDTFRQILTHLIERPDVDAVYAQIAEADPGDDMWPFTDTVFVVGTIPVDELRSAIDSLQPTELRDGNTADTSLADSLPDSPVLTIFWD
jgi:hypothetical protein